MTKLAAAPFRTELSEVGHDRVLALAGEFDRSHLPEVEAALREVEAASPEKIVLDLSDLMFIDSTGIAFLVEAVRRHEPGGDLRIKPSDADAVRRLLTMTGVDDYLPYLGKERNGSG